MPTDNFIRVAAASPITNVADIKFNLKNIVNCIDNAIEQGSKLVVFPELCITSYTCADLFWQQLLLNEAIDGVEHICSYSKEKDILIAVGAPLIHNNCLYNCAYIIFNGKVLGIVPKSYIPNYTEFYEKRWFTEGIGIVNKKVNLFFQEEIPFGTNLIFACGDFKFGFEICEDLWVTIPPSSYLSLMGANIIGNLSASNEIVSKADYRKDLVKAQSARCMASYIYASSGVFESTTDLVFSGDLLISENGSLLQHNNRFQRENEVITSIVDVNKLNSERLRNVSFRDSTRLIPVEPLQINFEFENLDYKNFDRYIDKHPFVPSNKAERDIRCKEIFNIQTSGLAKRISHTGVKKAVVGISGGLDSTLALLVMIKTFRMLNIQSENIITVTMPGFGTTDRTYNNAVNLCKKLGTEFREINIVPACLQHFKDISHDVEKHDVTYENVQARERTQILMDIANKEGGLLIGTGDLSELALGWCTYNGDHMSMYGVNCSIPKTLVRYLVKYVAETEVPKDISDILMDILDTPVSPELLPKDKNGEIAQKTEDIVGPYELHDFFLYNFIRQGAEPNKILFLAKEAFKDDYDNEIIEKWFEKFIKRFFTQQFKRSAIPDGPKVGTVSLSPRGDFRMPSDASYNLWK
ncbi:NAD synthetase [Clostridium carboxidivorans P7]|uniref:Glutamine-dependent NAD(+) synthetase n=1 Tax=Clostridium carboxidivorans P7 TaxID=536227 RepID=C6PNG2_9CLOT|nr:NAD(+) synthase [Clostridium carboxidivorans]AKN33557.1 NAD synthetase [Clostridium carboxidivorans P7]EET89283.1 NAD+ synthetase [Clostridium carboxidivorans P7]EFG86861.1 NAD+ synthetase [Clostridium carboxidivorans P7]